MATLTRADKIAAIDHKLMELRERRLDSVPGRPRYADLTEQIDKWLDARAVEQGSEGVGR